MNSALIEILGYPAEGLPYRWPHPWLVDQQGATQQQALVRSIGSTAYETPIRHRDGHLVWVTVSINAVQGSGSDEDVFVGTIRDITAERAFAARESAVLRLATAVAVAKSVDELLSITLAECTAAIDVQRVIAISWPAGEGNRPSRWRASSPKPPGAGWIRGYARPSRTRAISCR